MDWVGWLKLGWITGTGGLDWVRWVRLGGVAPGVVQVTWLLLPKPAPPSHNLTCMHALPGEHIVRLDADTWPGWVVAPGHAMHTSSSAQLALISASYLGIRHSLIHIAFVLDH